MTACGENCQNNCPVNGTMSDKEFAAIAIALKDQIEKGEISGIPVCWLSMFADAKTEFLREQLQKAK